MLLATTAQVAACVALGAAAVVAVCTAIEAIRDLRAWWRGRRG